MSKSPIFSLRDPVIYRGKTYTFPGYVCAITDDGQYNVRAVGTPDGFYAGMKHFFGEAQLEPWDEVQSQSNNETVASTPTPPASSGGRTVAPAEVYRIIKQVVIDKENVSAWSRRIAAALSSTDSPCSNVSVEPDYCYDPSEWEFTYCWEDRDQVHGHGEDLWRGEPMEVATLLIGPRKWVANVPITWDDDGTPLETEIRWFDSEADARAALSATATEGE